MYGGEQHRKGEEDESDLINLKRRVVDGTLPGTGTRVSRPRSSTRDPSHTHTCLSVWPIMSPSKSAPNSPSRIRQPPHPGPVLVVGRGVSILTLFVALPSPTDPTSTPLAVIYDRPLGRRTSGKTSTNMT